MVAVRANFPKFTPAEYLDWEEQQQFRHEYINGEVYAMTGGSVNHGQIAVERSNNHWLAIAGNLVNDSFFEDYVAAIDRYRQ